MVPPASHARTGRVVTAVFEPSLRSCGLHFLGNGNLTPRDFAAKNSLSTPHRSLRRPARTQKARQPRGNSRGLRKCPFARECVVADAVVLEPVSAPIFPANREKNRELLRIWPSRRSLRPVGERIQWLEAEFPTNQNRELVWRNREFRRAKQGVFPSVQAGKREETRRCQLRRNEKGFR